MGLPERPVSRRDRNGHHVVPAEDHRLVLVVAAVRRANPERLRQDFNRAAGAGDRFLRRLREGVGLHGDGRTELTTAEDLDELALDTRPRASRLSGVTSERPDSAIVSRLIAWYSTRNGVGEGSFAPAGSRASDRPRNPPEPCCERADLGAEYAVLPPLPPIPRLALATLAGAVGRLQIVNANTHQLDPSTDTRCGTRAIMPRISGRSGSVGTADATQTEGTKRASLLGLAADIALELGDLERHQSSSSSFGLCSPRSLSW